MGVKIYELLVVSRLARQQGVGRRSNSKRAVTPSKYSSSNTGEVIDKASDIKRHNLH